MTNLLNFIDCMDIDQIKKDDMPISFKLINLHTYDLKKAVDQCKKFFANYQILEYENEQKNIYKFYTAISEYCYCGGYCYTLKKSRGKSTTYWLVLENEKNYFEI